MTCRFIDAERRNHGIATMCRALRVSRSGFYAWQARGISPRAASDLLLAAKVAAIHAESDGTYGTPRVHAELAAQGIRVSRRRVARLMAEQGLEGVSRRTRGRSTTAPTDRPAAPDLVERRFDRPPAPTRSGSPTSPTCPPGRAGSTWPWWSTPAAGGWSAGRCARASRRSWSWTPWVWRRPAAARAPRRSITQIAAPSTPRRSSGAPWPSQGLWPRWAASGSALDNAAAESAIASFKTEFVHRRSFRSRNAAREQIFRWIEGWYNRRRRHSSLGYLSPADYEELHAKTSGPCGPADPGQPALDEGALAGVGTRLLTPAPTCPRK